MNTASTFRALSKIPDAAHDAVQPTTELGASTLLSDALFGSDSYDVYENLWDDEKQEIVELLDTLKGLEETAAANKQTGYQSAVKKLIDFMEEHGLKVPAKVKDNLDSLTPGSRSPSTSIRSSVSLTMLTLT